MFSARHVTIVCAAAAVAGAMTAGTASAATTTEVVRAGDLGGAWHTADTRPPGSLELSSQYGGAQGSNGAAVFTTPDGNAKVQLFTDEYDGLRLDQITALSYSAYRVSGTGVAGNPAVTALNLRVDLGDGDPDVDAYLVYEPYRTEGDAAVHEGEWQTWDAWQNGQAKWWSGQISGLCGADAPCTVTELLTQYPDATIREDDHSLRSSRTPADADFHGALGFNQGSGNPGLVSAADMLHLATTTGVDVTYDFEAPVVLHSKEECKDGGWATSTDPVFRNQGECVSSFASKKKALRN